MSALNLGRRRTRSPRRVTARMVTVSLGFLLAIGSAGLTAVPAHADGCGVLVSGASPAAERAVAAACRMVGKPYAWGGGHEGLPAPSQGHIDVGDPINSGHDGSYWSFDCAGLMRWAWFEATGRDLLGPGTVDSQHTVASGLSGSRVFTKADGLSPLLPGDLLYFRDFKGLHHTSMYLGAGKVVQARQSGEPIGVGTPNMDEYDGAIRLSADQPSPPFRYGNEGKSEKTWGRPNYRTGRNTSSEIKYTGAGGSANVRVLCQANGEEVTVDGMTNYVWSYLPEYELWVSNIFIQGPAVLPDVPPCSSYPAIGGEFTTPGGTDKAFSTWGTDVRVKSEPNTNSSTVHNFPGPTPIQVSCQKHAQLVESEGYSNDVWSYLPQYGGWMTNIYIQGPAWLTGVPDCDGGGGSSGPATCADNSAPAGSGAYSPKATSIDGRTIELRYNATTQCAWGRITNGYEGDEVWVDRSRDNGQSWEPWLGSTSITTGSDVYTTQWNDAGVLMRACGHTNDIGSPVVCTDWF